jgi:hypothetical protein
MGQSQRCPDRDEPWLSDEMAQTLKRKLDDRAGF